MFIVQFIALLRRTAGQQSKNLLNTVTFLNETSRSWFVIKIGGN